MCRKSSKALAEYGQTRDGLRTPTCHLVLACRCVAVDDKSSKENKKTRDCDDETVLPSVDAVWSPGHTLHVCTGHALQTVTYRFFMLLTRGPVSIDRPEKITHSDAVIEQFLCEFERILPIRTGEMRIFYYTVNTIGNLLENV